MTCTRRACETELRGGGDAVKEGKNYEIMHKNLRDREFKDKRMLFDTSAQ